jgi:hypothetical protein
MDHPLAMNDKLTPEPIGEHLLRTGAARPVDRVVVGMRDEADRSRRDVVTHPVVGKSD